MYDIAKSAEVRRVFFPLRVPCPASMVPAMPDRETGPSRQLRSHRKKRIITDNITLSRKFVNREIPYEAPAEPTE